MPPVPYADVGDRDGDVDWSSVRDVYAWHLQQRPAPWMPSLESYLAMRGASNPAFPRLTLYDAGSFADGGYQWGPCYALRKVGLFAEYRYFERKKDAEATHMVQAWQAFQDNWHRYPTSWMSRLGETRARFGQHAGRGIAMAVHFECFDANIPCAVPRDISCDFCGGQGAGPAIEEVVSGHVPSSMPTVVRDMIVRINGPHGGHSSAASAAPRTAARGRERPRAEQPGAPRYRSPSRSRASAQGTRGPMRSGDRRSRYSASGYGDPGAPQPRSESRQSSRSAAEVVALGSSRGSHDQTPAAPVSADADLHRLLERNFLRVRLELDELKEAHKKLSESHVQLEDDFDWLQNEHDVLKCDHRGLIADLRVQGIERGCAKEKRKKEAEEASLQPKRRRGGDSA